MRRTKTAFDLAFAAVLLGSLVQAAAGCPDMAGLWYYRETSAPQEDFITVRQQGCAAVTIVEPSWLTAFTGSQLTTDGVEYPLGPLPPSSGRLTGCFKFRQADWQGNALRIRTRLECSGMGDSSQVFLTLIDPSHLKIGLNLDGRADPSESVYTRR